MSAVVVLGMNDEQEKLKLRLKLKRLSRSIDKVVEWNFGHSPNGDAIFDRALEERQELLNIAKEKYPDVYEDFNY